MKPLLLPLPGNELLATELAKRLGGEIGRLEMRKFPDGETYLRIKDDVWGRVTALVGTLDQPDAKFLPLAFAAGTVRELGAATVGLVAPYLAYMRQDRSFNDGEAVTSSHFACLLSTEFDWLATVDPHLHRYGDLSEIYTIPTRVAHAAPLIAQWIRANVSNPLVIGPDQESEQWVSAIAAEAKAPYVVLTKRRLGDRQVETSVPDMAGYARCQPILADDIVSSARTMVEASRQLTARGMAAPICIAVHALFSGDAYVALSKASSRIVSTNTVLHESNAIDVSEVLAAKIADLVGRSSPGPSKISSPAAGGNVNWQMERK